jgi:voltage-gated potassium channel
VTRASGQQFGAWQLVMLVLSVYVLIAIEAIVDLPASTKTILNAVDAAICVVFLTDFVVSFIRAPRKLDFLRWGWIDLLSSIPTLDSLRWGRLAKILRILRVLRAVRSVKVIAQGLNRHRTSTSLAILVLTSLTLVLTSSLLILELETTPDATIRTPQDALWWSFSTIATVGYGDRYPVTSAGRILGVVLMTAGVGVFGTVTAAVGAWLMRAPESSSDGENTRVEETYG